MDIEETKKESLEFTITFTVKNPKQEEAIRRAKVLPYKVNENLKLLERL